MSKPKHRRCQVCQCVTARWARTYDAGAFVVQVWTRDEHNGEVITVNGTVIRCTAHAEAAELDRDAWPEHVDGCEEGDEERLGHCAPDCPRLALARNA